jgi:hypothetical protein
MQTQVKRLHDYLKKNKTITNLEAYYKLGILHNPRRIADLKDRLPRSYRIDKRMITVQNRWQEKCRVAEYKLVRTP